MKYTVILISLFFFPIAILYAQNKDCKVDFSKYKFSCNLPCEVKLVTANDSLIRYEGLIKQGGSEYVAVDFTFTPNSNPSIGETVALMEGYYRKLKFTGDKGTYKGMRYNNRLAGPSQVDELFIDSDFLDYPDGRNSVGIIRNDYIYRSCEGVAIFSITFPRGPVSGPISRKIYDDFNFQWDDHRVQDTALQLNYTIPTGLFKLTSKNPAESIRLVDCLNNKATSQLTILKMPYEGGKIKDVKSEFFRLLKSTETAITPHIFYFRNPLKTKEIQLFQHSEKVDSDTVRDFVNYFFTENNRVYRAELVCDRELTQSPDIFFGKGLKFLTSINLN